MKTTSKKIIQSLLALFLLVLAFYLQSKPVYADVFFRYSDKDSCSIFKFNESESPNCNMITTSANNTCSLKTPKQPNNNLNAYTFKLTASTIDGKSHSLCYSYESSFCIRGYDDVKTATCNCWGNVQQPSSPICVTNITNQTFSMSRSPINGYSYCGSYQLDFFVTSVDGKNNCIFGNASLSGASGYCETGTTCRGAAPTPTNTPAPRPTATNTPAPRPTATNTPAPRPTPTNTPAPRPTATNTPAPRPTATPTPPSTSCQINNSDIMLIIDASGSMNPNLSDVRKAATHFIDQVSKDPTNRIGFVAFNQQENVGVLPETKLYDALTNNWIKLKADVNTYISGQTSCAQCGIRLSNKEISSSGRNGITKAAILITDGLPNEAEGNLPYPTQDPNYAATQALNEAISGYKANGTTFYTIGMGFNPVGNFLQQMAQQTKGTSYYALKSSDLDNIYQQIFKNSVCPTLTPTATPTPTLPNTITGNVYIDQNTDGYYQPATDAPFTGTIQLDFIDKNTSAIVAQVNQAGPSYTTTLPSGKYTVKYKGPPTGYYMTYPLTSIPPSFDVSIGSPCTTTSKEASCSNGNISKLNFGIIDALPWIQNTCGDARIDSGFTATIPPNPTNACGTPNGSYEIVSNNTCSNTPGIVFSGATGNPTTMFGATGKASIANWIVGGSAYPESFSPVNTATIRTSYSYLSTSVRKSGITPIDLATVPGCSNFSNCNLPPTLAHGVYQAGMNSSTPIDLTLQPYTFPANQDYIILIHGNLHIQGPIHVPVGSTVVFAVSDNITVDQSVGETTPTSCQSDVEGFYSADNSFIVNSVGGCTIGPDKRLNIAGSIIANAALNGGSFQNTRDLCSSNSTTPAITFTQRPDFILNAPALIKRENHIWQEIAP